MTDFLTSLTARSFGNETGIRPRAASLFEPLRTEDSVPREAPTAEPNETAISREVDAASGGERRMRPPDLTKPESEKAKEAMHDAQEDLSSVVASQPRGDSAGRKRSISDTKGWQEEDSAVAATVPPRRFSTSQRQTSSETYASSFPYSHLDAAPKWVSPKVSGSSLSRGEFVEKDNRGLVVPPKVAAGVAMQMGNAAAAMNAEPGAPKREKASSASPALTTASEPSVHVTIGRIEVRAVSESKPAGRARAASPVMSLEEYLHRRTQRGDR
jgi:hypothetical protein